MHRPPHQVNHLAQTYLTFAPRLARLGNIYPIGKSVGTVNVGGKSWDLWVGMNGSMKVFSFISQGTTYNWSGDAKQFFTYLQNSQGFPASSQNLIGE